MEEIWKPTIGFEEAYEDSNYGRIRSIDRINHQGIFYKGIVLKPCVASNGYPLVTLMKNGRQHSLTLHRLIALNHVDGYFDGAIVNHKDSNRTNNHSSNLEWCDYYHNNEHGGAKYYLVTFPCGKEEIVYNINKFCKKLGLSSSNMYQVAKGNKLNYKGFRCVYIGENNGYI